jgi:hypothetical protein
MPKYRITSPDGKTFEVTAPDGASMEEVQAYAMQNMPQPKKTLPSGVNVPKPTDDMSRLDLFRAGLGKSMVDTVRGVGQLVGLVSEKDIDEAKKLDKALMDTGFGTAGKVAGDIASIIAPGTAAAKYGAQIPKIGKAVETVGKLVTTPKGVIPAVTGGAILGATQPVGTDDSRLLNTAISAGAGGALPLIATGAGVGKTLFHDIWSKSGQEAMAGGILERVATSSSDDIIRQIDNTQPIFPGYTNTLPESLVGDNGIATFAHTQASRDPFSTGTKTKLNTKAQELTNRILSEFENYAGTPERKAALQDEINAAVSGLYQQGKATNVPMSPELLELIDRPVIRQATNYRQESLANRGQDFSNDLDFILNRPQPTTSTRIVNAATVKPVSSAGEQGLTKGPDIAYQVSNTTSQSPIEKFDPLTMTNKPRTVTGADLHGIKIGVNDLRNQAISDTRSGKLKDRIFSMDDAKARLTDFLPDELRQADAAYSELAKQQSQMNVFDSLLNMQNPVLKDSGFGTIYANKMSNALDSDKLARLSTGWERTKSLGDVLTPEQMAVIDQAEKALQTQAIIAKQGSAKGSPTGQNETGRQLISGLVRGLGLPDWIPDNAFAQTLIETPLSRTLFRIPEVKVDRMLSDALVDPNYAKQLLQQRQSATQPTSLGKMLERQFLPAMGATSYITEQ